VESCGLPDTINFFFFFFYGPLKARYNKQTEKILATKNEIIKINKKIWFENRRRWPRPLFHLISKEDFGGGGADSGSGKSPQVNPSAPVALVLEKAVLVWKSNQGVNFWVLGGHKVFNLNRLFLQ
jgi:hypothetical protein